MKLFYVPGASSLAPHIALREADRSFDLERVDLKTHRTASGADYLAINPKGGVPALQLGGLDSEILTDTPTILQYIADLVPERQLAPPSGTFARYHLQELLGYIALELHARFEPLFHPETTAPMQARARGKIGECFLYLSDVLLDRGYLMGETFTVADCYMVPILRWCERFELDLQIWPNLDAYYLHVVERPAVQAALAAEGLVESRRLRRTA